MRNYLCNHGLATFLLISMMAFPAEAITRRVAQDGSGDFLTIQPAIDASSPGDTVSIAPGRYTDFAPFQTGAIREDCFGAITVDSLTIIGDSAESVIVGPETQDWTPNGPWGFATLYPTTTFTRIENVGFVNVMTGILASGGGEFFDIQINDVDIGISCCCGAGFDIARLTTSGVLSPVAGGSESIGVRIRDSAFEGCSGNSVLFSTGSTGFEIMDCVFEDCSINLSLSSDGVVRSIIMTGERAGLNVSDFSRLAIYDSRIGPALLCASIDGEAWIEGSGNVFKGGTVTTLRFTGNSLSGLAGNHILRTGTGLLVETAAYRTHPIQIDLRNNWWGTTNIDSLNAWIVDGEELHDPPFFPNLSEVLFEPFAPKPVEAKQESMGSFKARFDGQ